MNKLLIIFVLLSIANVIIQTVKSLVTVKCGKGLASIVNAIAFGLYTVVIVYTNADFPLWEKVVITALVNLIGVYIVKLAEEKMRKDRLWKIEVTVRNENALGFENALKGVELPFNTIEIAKYTIFNIYCETQADSTVAKGIIEKFNAKYFVTESKAL